MQDSELLQHGSEEPPQEAGGEERQRGTGDPEHLQEEFRLRHSRVVEALRRLPGRLVPPADVRASTGATLSAPRSLTANGTLLCLVLRSPRSSRAGSDSIVYGAQ